MLEIGTTSEAAYVADDDDMASSFSVAEQDIFPQVFSTARMIALMETAGARALRPLLQPGQLSVGVTVNIRHLAATPNHTQVSAQATFLGMEGKLYKFKVEAFDPGGKIGEGEHTRAIISTERLMQGAKARLQPTGARSGATGAGEKG
jgi:fluoroacetyl-CoA thioesterase